MHNLVDVCGNHSTLKLQRTRFFFFFKCDLQFIFLTHVTSKQGYVRQTYNDNSDPSKVIIMKSLKGLTLMVSGEKATLKVFLVVV